jgi:hypothetical protein
MRISDSYLRPNGVTDLTPLRQAAGGTDSHCANALANALLPEKPSKVAIAGMLLPVSRSS